MYEFGDPLKFACSSLADLMVADLNEDDIILCGRTGTLYKAKLPDGFLLAVKQLQPCLESKRGFKGEMKAPPEAPQSCSSSRLYRIVYQTYLVVNSRFTQFRPG